MPDGAPLDGWALRFGKRPESFRFLTSFPPCIPVNLHPLGNFGMRLDEVLPLCGVPQQVIELP